MNNVNDKQQGPLTLFPLLFHKRYVFQNTLILFKTTLYTLVYVALTNKGMSKKTFVNTQSRDSGHIKSYHTW